MRRRVIFSNHASKQRVERKIPKKIVLETIKNPQKILKSYKNRQLLQKQFSGKILEVVMVKEENGLVVITQYFLEKE